jgi:hypothetical protein
VPRNSAFKPETQVLHFCTCKRLAKCSADRVLPMQVLRPHHVSAGIEASRRARIPFPPAEPPVLVLWLNQPHVFVVNRRKPRVQTPVVRRYPTPARVHDFVLLFLPPCGPHSTPLATGSLKLSLLVSPLLGGPARHRPFALALHLHQSKSSRNLHL